MDSDSDSDDFVPYGTPLELIEEDEPLPKPVAVKDQVVKDKQGRQRFHGAFTGGFSAGFFNTVGSKEGFTPSTFVSSRSKKAAQNAQRPEDYMDDDDIGEFGIAPRKVVTTERFAGEGDTSKKRPAQGSGIIPGDDGRIEELIKPSDDTIGTRLLRRMGWKPGQGIGPKMERRTRTKKRRQKGNKKTYGCERPPGLEPPSQKNDEDNEDEAANDSQEERAKEDEEEEEDDEDSEEEFLKGFLFAPDDIQDFIFALKDDVHGIGYQGMDSSRSILGGHVTLFDEPVTNKSRRQGIQGHAFGIGAFEDDDHDVYSTDRLSNYDRVLGGEEEMEGKTGDQRGRGMYGWTGPPKKQSDESDVLDGFVAAQKRKLSTKIFHPPALPRDFRPFHQFGVASTEVTPHPKEAPQGHSRFTLSANQRAAMLGEEQLPGPSSVEELLSQDALTFLKEARNKAIAQERAPQPGPGALQQPPAPPSQPSRWDQGQGAPAWAAPTQVARGGEEVGSSFKPFAKDPEKQKRYEDYVKNRHQAPGGLSRAGPGDEGRTEWERQQERDEFARASALYKPMSGLMASRFTRAKQADDDGTVEVPAETGGDQNDQAKAAEMKMFGQLTRDSMEWHPDKLLCKRFNIADPYPESTVVGLPTVKKDRFSVFNFLEVPQATSSQIDIYPSKSSNLSGASAGAQDDGLSVGVRAGSSSDPLKRSRWDQHPGILAAIGTRPADGGTMAPAGKEKHTETVPSGTGAGATGDHEGDEDMPRPPLDLFQAIFLNSDDSTSDEDEPGDDEEDEKEKNEYKRLGLSQASSMSHDSQKTVTQGGYQSITSVSMATGSGEDVHHEGEGAQGSTAFEAAHRNGDNDGERMKERGKSEKEPEEGEEEMYGPMLPPPPASSSSSADKAHEGTNRYAAVMASFRRTESPLNDLTMKSRRTERDRRKERRMKDKKKKSKRSRGRSRDREDSHRKDKHRRDTSQEQKHNKPKKSKHRHDARHKSSHRESSKSKRRASPSSSSDSDASLSSEDQR